jgi:hypothetical protein
VAPSTAPAAGPGAPPAGAPLKRRARGFLPGQPAKRAVIAVAQILVVNSGSEESEVEIIDADV